MGVIDDSTRADDPDALAEVAWQFRFVVEMRENVGHYRSPFAEQNHGVCCARAFWIAARASLASASLGFKSRAIPSSFSASSNFPVRKYIHPRFLCRCAASGH